MGFTEVYPRRMSILEITVRFQYGQIHFASGLTSSLNNSLFPLYCCTYVHTFSPTVPVSSFLPSVVPFSRAAICCQARSRVFPNVAGANGISAARSGNQE